MSPVDAGAFEMDAGYRVGPTVFGRRTGTLRFADGRLSFIEGSGTIRFDAPLANAAHYENQKAAARDLLALIEARVGPPPPGVRVRAPAGGVGYALKAVAVVVVITAAIFGLMWAVYG
jgi:hypothetical protein